MSYYSDTFNTMHKPQETEMFYNVTSEKIYKFLDFLFLSLDMDVQKYNYSLKTPKNILVSFDKRKFRVFLGNDKAIAEMNIIAYQTHEQNVLPSLKDANKMGIQQLGFEFDYYFDVEISQFSEAIPFTENNFEKSKTDKLREFRDLCIRVGNFLQDNKIKIALSNVAFFNCWLKAHQQIIVELERNGLAMDINPRFKARGIVVNPKQCFYVMDFKDPDIDEARGAIAQKLQDQLGIKVVKSGDIFDPNRGNDLVENIWQDIMASRFIIVDLSKKNPNVFYELGICDTVGKTVIPICSEKSYKENYGGKFPFDIQQEFTILYENGFNGISALQNKVLKRAKAITEGQTINTQK
ncbi:hypothetical protein [Limosilactobacillus fermentum]|uniref:hypothetical protein n=1 Tax=Limosilactobacillus fermentum TaxID=1613 RepID=UPI002090F31D|nr:hypothetical protein [Limosilactobacillus fermentum]UVF14233.1 hypothetical protein NHG87_003375 [Limosilactobacillus fermentum]